MWAQYVRSGCTNLRSKLDVGLVGLVGRVQDSKPAPSSKFVCLRTPFHMSSWRKAVHLGLACAVLCVRCCDPLTENANSWPCYYDLVVISCYIALGPAPAAQSGGQVSFTPI